MLRDMKMSKKLQQQVHKGQSMVDYFRVDDADAIRVMPDDLRRTVSQIFEELGFPEDDARIATDVLVLADTMGVDTHGVSNMMRQYVESVRKGFLNTKPNWRIIRERASAVNIDCDAGLGLVLCPKAMEIAIEKAEKTGMCMVTMGNGRHNGMVAYHAMLALPHDMIGYAITSGGDTMVPTYGAEPRLSPNPHAWAVPAEKEPPLIVDISATRSAFNKLGLLKRMQKDVPIGFITDTNGIPVIEEGPLPDEFNLLPLGATPELGSHKGYGLAAVSQILAGLLSNGAFGPYGMGHMSHCVAAYSIDAFTDVSRFKSDMDRFLRYLRETPPAEGYDRVYYPGLIEYEEAEKRKKIGIPLHAEVISWFDSATEEMKLEPLVR